MQFFNTIQIFELKFQKIKINNFNFVEKKVEAVDDKLVFNVALSSYLLVLVCCRDDLPLLELGKF